MSLEHSKKVLIALDYDDQQTALNFVKQLSPDTCRLKVGKEMFTYFGPAFVKELIDLGFDVFLDLKFHDIPNTVAKAVTAAAKMGVWMVNVHASGGVEMMTKAKQALEQFGDKAPLLIAVTVLTSMDAAELTRLGVDKTPEEQVIYLAKL
ncbi:MAG: orotidine-5'-phosphate decarboxylase, partial [Pseudoalteromonas rhizosphaerae]|uniref:orotidine-5'-phosphate decarboxylase n=1 Tax=Pseudoalteromonas rhizosphaerae TaxID=2518973 RepID=UPI003C73BD35